MHTVDNLQPTNGNMYYILDRAMQTGRAPTLAEAVLLAAAAALTPLLCPCNEQHQHRKVGRPGRRAVEINDSVYYNLDRPLQTSQFAAHQNLCGALVRN